MSYSFRIKDMSASKLIDTSASLAQNSSIASRRFLAERLNNPHAMWLTLVILGFALLIIAAMWFSAIGAFYSAGIKDGVDAIGAVAGALSLPF